jgi:hypothetical protein
MEYQKRKQTQKKTEHEAGENPYRVRSSGRDAYFRTKSCGISGRLNSQLHPVVATKRAKEVKKTFAYFAAMLLIFMM